MAFSATSLGTESNLKVICSMLGVSRGTTGTNCCCVCVCARLCVGGVEGEGGISIVRKMKQRTSLKED